MTGWFRRILVGRPDRDADGREPVYLATAPLPEASLLAATLRSHGIDARCIESTNPLTRSLTDGKVFVPRSQLPRAEALLEGDDPGHDHRDGAV